MERKWWVEKGFFGRYRVCTDSAISASTLVAGSIYYEDDASLIASAPDMRSALADLWTLATTVQVDGVRGCFVSEGDWRRLVIDTLHTS